MDRLVRATPQHRRAKVVLAAVAYPLHTVHTDCRHDVGFAGL